MNPQKLTGMLIPKSLKPQARHLAWRVESSMDSLGLGTSPAALKRAAPEIYQRIAGADMAPALRRRLVSLLSDGIKGAAPSLPQHIETGVLYVAGGLTADAIKDAMALQQRAGQRCVLLYMMGKDNGNGELARKHGIEVIEYEDAWRLAQLLVSSSASFTIARRGNVFEAALGALFGPGKVIYKPYDFILRYPQEMLSDMFPVMDVCLAEQFVLGHTDGLMHFHEDAALQFIRDNYGYTGLGEQVRPACMDEFCFRPGLPKLSGSDGNIHIVYAAGLARIDADRRMAGKSDNYHDFVKILDAGLHLHVYVPYMTRRDREYGLRHYFELADEYPNFHMENTLPYEQVALDLTRYDYAYCYAPRRGTIRLREFEGNLTNNFYTYMDASLPVLCSPDSWAMARLVEEKGIGVVLRDGDMERIGEIIGGLDHRQLAASVDAARPSMMYDSERLVSFLNEVSGIRVYS